MTALAEWLDYDHERNDVYRCIRCSKENIGFNVSRFIDRAKLLARAIFKTLRYGKKCLRITSQQSQSGLTLDVTKKKSKLHQRHFFQYSRSILLFYISCVPVDAYNYRYVIDYLTLRLQYLTRYKLDSD